MRRTGIGSDFEVESDFVENDEEMGLELAGPGGSTLIEVKSTRVDQVKMTPVQADRACSLHDRFALCVVPLDDDLPTGETIREQLRVVFDIGGAPRVGAVGLRSFAANCRRRLPTARRDRA